MWNELQRRGNWLWHSRLDHPFPIGNERLATSLCSPTPPTCVRGTLSLVFSLFYPVPRVLARCSRTRWPTPPRVCAHRPRGVVAGPRHTHTHLNLLHVLPSTCPLRRLRLPYYTLVASRSGQPQQGACSPPPLTFHTSSPTPHPQISASVQLPPQSPHTSPPPRLSGDLSMQLLPEQLLLRSLYTVAIDVS
jgi:hypothetical protein